jgi:hypothetical protein
MEFARMRQVIPAVVFVTLISGCVAVPKVPEASGNKPVSSMWSQCSKPFVLTQDCSNHFGPRRKVYLNGQDLLVAGSAVGTKIVVMEAHWLRNSSLYANPFLLSNPTVSYASNAVYQEVENYLKGKSVTVLKVVPLGDAYTTAGYALELDADGYRWLLSLPPKK